MTRLVAPLLLMVLFSACDERRTPVLPAPTGVASPPVVPTPTAAARPIVVGEKVQGTFKGADVVFELTAPRDATLVAEVTWDVSWNGTLLVLQMQNTQFQPAPPAWSPVSGKLRVVAGETYRLIIKAGGTDWAYDDVFTLVTALE